jgi:hypothetical protein
MNGINNFSTLSKFYGKTDSPCMSQDASPLLYGRNGGYDWNNQAFMGSEHSAFKRGSPRFNNNAMSGFGSGANTPKLLN